MRKTRHFFPTLLLFCFFACKKSSDSQISLTPSATEVGIGQTVSVTLSANANASNWTATPSSTATQTFSLTTSKVNNFTFSSPGVYTVSVRARNIAYDSTTQSLTNAWNTGGGTRGGCTKGIDTASVAITVVK